jgi:catechol 2,3-dioxygenase
MPEFPVCDLRSVELIVPDLAAAERFYTETWGLAVAAREDGAVYLRASGDDYHVLALQQGPAAAIRSITFRVTGPDVLNDIAARTLRHAGRVIAPVAPADDPAGGTALIINDPQDRVLRFVHGDARRIADPPRRDRPTRLSHVNVNSIATDAAAAFLDDVLGFKLTDRSKLMAFVRCNSDHHVIVIADAPVNSLNHIAFMMPDLEGVMIGSGRMVDHGFPIAWGVGRHGPGDNVFSYFIDPFGIVIEYTAEVLQVDDTYLPRGPADWTWPPGRTDQWGIAPPKSERLKHAQQAIMFLPVPAFVG